MSDIKKVAGIAIANINQICDIDFKLDSYTKLLLHCDGIDASTYFPDSSLSNHSITANGNAQVDTAQKVFGTGSGLFDGTNSDLSIPDSDDWYFGSGDFTIDFRIRWNTLPALNTSDMLLTQFQDGSNLWFFYMQNTASQRVNFQEIVNDVNVVVATIVFDSNIVAGTWYHFALVKASNVYHFYIDGVEQGSGVTDTDALTNLSNSLSIGSNAQGGGYLDGWIDELRISKGIARWTSNFTSPAAAYSPAIKKLIGVVN